VRDEPIYSDRPVAPITSEELSRAIISIEMDYKTLTETAMGFLSITPLLEAGQLPEAVVQLGANIVDLATKLIEATKR